MKIFLYLAILTLVSISARATVIYLDSDAATTTNDSGQSTVDLSGALHPNPDWSAALPASEWISYGPTGAHTDPGYSSPLNGTQVIFTTTFVLSGTITAASLMVMADESTSLILNGQTLWTANITPTGDCASLTIGCRATTEGVFTLASLSPYLVDGSNTLSFAVLQVHGSSFGLDFAGSVDDNAATPEPGTLAFIGGGLITLAVLRRRK